MLGMNVGHDANIFHMVGGNGVMLGRGVVCIMHCQKICCAFCIEGRMIRGYYVCNDDWVRVRQRTTFGGTTGLGYASNRLIFVDTVNCIMIRKYNFTVHKQIRLLVLCNNAGDVEQNT